MRIERSTIIKGSTLILLVLLMLFLQFKLDIASYLSSERIKSWLNQAGLLAPILFMIVMALSSVITPIPGLPLAVAAGAFFGPFLGTLYSASGALGGAVISFLIARYLGQEIVERFIGSHINLCTSCSNKLLTRIVFISRLIPFISFDVISYGAGLAKMSVKRFALATFIGMLPMTFIYNYFGTIIISGEWIQVTIAIIVIAIFFLLPWSIERYDLFSWHKYFQHEETQKSK